MVNLKKKYLKYKQKYLMDKLKGGFGVSTIFDALFSKEIQRRYGEEDLSEKLSFISYHLESMKKLEDFFTTISVSAQSLSGVASVADDGSGDTVTVLKVLVDAGDNADANANADDDNNKIRRVQPDKGISKKIMPSIRRSIIEQEQSFEKNITKFIKKVDPGTDTDAYQQAVIKGIFEVFTEILEEEYKNNPSLSTSVKGDTTALQRSDSLKQNDRSNSGALLYSTDSTNTEGSVTDSVSLTEKNVKLKQSLDTSNQLLKTKDDAKELFKNFNAFIKTSIHLQIKYEHILQYIYSIYLVLIYKEEKSDDPLASGGAQSVVTTPKFNDYIKKEDIDYLYLPIFYRLDDKTLIELYQSRLTKIFKGVDVPESKNQGLFLDYIKQVQGSIKNKLNELDQQINQQSKSKDRISAGEQKLDLTIGEQKLELTVEQIEKGTIINYGEHHGGKCVKRALVVELVN
tara:strand:+ start:950 stop:2323 length:1374 start_codon:yes stop_codon:yes gene_type:complete